MASFKCAVCLEMKEKKAENSINYCAVCKEQNLCRECLSLLMVDIINFRLIFEENSKPSKCPCCRTDMYKVLYHYNVVNVMNPEYWCEIGCIKPIYYISNSPIRKFVFNLFNEDDFESIEEYDKNYSL